MIISLLTIWHIGNYGAELQTYCTVKILERLGHKVRVIRYDLSEENSNTTLKLKTFVFNVVTGLMPASLKSHIFWWKHIPSTRKYKSVSDLYSNVPKADAYLVGSDQVWNIDITKESAPLYFLDFVKTDAKRISYASSFGSDEWHGDENITVLAKNALKSFTAISCREKSGVRLLNDIFQIKGKCVIDPTLLVEDFKELTGIITQRETLLYYPLSPNEEVELFCKDLSKELGLIFKQANKKTIIGHNMLWDKPSVPQWLRSIGEARFVITPSFHGLTTSIQLHRNFAVLMTEPIIIERSARVRDLLTELGLSNRIFFSIDDFRQSKIWESEIDYCKIDAKLAELRNKSLQYLIASL